MLYSFLWMWLFLLFFYRFKETTKGFNFRFTSRDNLGEARQAENREFVSYTCPIGPSTAGGEVPEERKSTRIVRDSVLTVFY